MQEASEALDLMNSLYQLQHLDIKPQNLFLIHQHVKVADFGLVKDLEGTQASVTGGVTPVYAAPETFDGKVTRFSDQYTMFSEFKKLDNASIARFLTAAQALDRVPDRIVRADAMGIMQANVGLWQILARQGQIPEAKWNESWQQMLAPFSGIGSGAQLFDAGRASLGELARGAIGKTQISQDELIALLAGPSQGNTAGQQMRQELVDAFERVDLVNLRAADRRVEDLDQHLPGVELLRQGDLVDHQRLARLRQNRGAALFDLHRRLAIRNR